MLFVEEQPKSKRRRRNRGQPESDEEDIIEGISRTNTLF